ncbi:hypothetical protein GJAV_G00275380 [Gymnothorax javanicus]|nr:hypothetical protein GJAV_G00275380 [Gymnothorax javanicus]
MQLEFISGKIACISGLNSSFRLLCLCYVRLTSNYSFSSGATRRSLNGHFASFQENFIKDDLKFLSRKNKEKYLRLVYIRTEQRKLLRTLEKEIQQRKKRIYNSLSDSVRDTMKPTYQECSKISGKETLVTIKEQLIQAIERSKNTMFRHGMKTMLEDVRKLQKYLTEKIQNGMTTSLKVALKQIPDDLTGLPDVTEEHEMMKQCCESLNLQIF